MSGLHTAENWKGRRHHPRLACGLAWATRPAGETSPEVDGLGGFASATCRLGPRGGAAEVLLSPQLIVFPSLACNI